MKNFDTFMGIDWSGAKSPIMTKAIAVAECKQGDAPPRLVPGPWSRTKVYDYIGRLLSTDTRRLIGIDANFGYAQETGLSQFGQNYDYRDLWHAVESANLKNDNFFAEGFWQKYPQYFWTGGPKPAHISLPKRLTEITCGQAGYGWPESPFKLLGPKQVGKGGLAAMRMAHHLKKAHGDKICIWPFEQEIADSAQIVITEIYPRQFLRRSAHGNAKVQTLEELNQALSKLGCKKPYNADEFNDHDADALVSAAGLRMLCGKNKTIPGTIANPEILDKESAKREGWIFGVGDN